MIKYFISVLLITLSSRMIQAQTNRPVSEANGLEAGSQAPDFTAADQNGKKFNLKNALKQGPVLLVFYRGVWCPYCNKHLSAIQDSLNLLKERGIEVVAVSPEKPEYGKKMESRTGAEFSLLYDENYTISEAFDVLFLPEKKQIKTYNIFLSAELKKSHSDDSQVLPVPATFLIGTNGKILMRNFNRDYKNRSSVSEILDFLDKHKI